MPILLLAVYSTDPDTNADCDVAVVEMSPVLARTGLTRMDRAGTRRGEEPELCAWTTAISTSGIIRSPTHSTRGSNEGPGPISILP